MPLFMDRHDLPGATAEQVAQAHLGGRQVMAGNDVEFKAYWFDPGSSAAFCLASAPSPHAMQAVHLEVHGLISNEIIAVAEDDVLRFLGRIADPADRLGVPGAFRTIMFTDLKDSTSLLVEVGEGAYMECLAEHDAIIRRSLVASRGREVKHTGDGIMASFDDVGNALGCSLAVQDAFIARNSARGAPQLRVRIGIAAGEPVDRNDDLFGSTVNLASRICAAAQPDQILTSAVVREMGVERGYSFDGGRELELKGFTTPVPVFALCAERGAP